MSGNVDKIDMSLDDIIKLNKKQNKKVPKKKVIGQKGISPLKRKQKLQVGNRQLNQQKKTQQNSGAYKNNGPLQQQQTKKQRQQNQQQRPNEGAKKGNIQQQKRAKLAVQNALNVQNRKKQQNFARGALVNVRRGLPQPSPQGNVNQRGRGGRRGGQRGGRGGRGGMTTASRQSYGVMRSDQVQSQPRKQINRNQFQQPRGNQNQFQQPRGNQNQFQQPRAIQNQFQQPRGNGNKKRQRGRTQQPVPSTMTISFANTKQNSGVQVMLQKRSQNGSQNRQQMPNNSPPKAQYQLYLEQKAKRDALDVKKLRIQKRQPITAPVQQPSSASFGGGVGRGRKRNRIRRAGGRQNVGEQPQAQIQYNPEPIARQNYQFNATDFSKGATGVRLSDRFAGVSGGTQVIRGGGRGGRKVFL